MHIHSNKYSTTSMYNQPNELVKWFYNYYHMKVKFSVYS